MGRGRNAPIVFSIVGDRIMSDVIKELIQIQLTPNQIMFTGKWLIAVPFILVNTWIYWRALKSFAPRK